MEDNGQTVLPGAEASTRQAIQARAEAPNRGSVPQQGVDDFGLFDSGNNQRPLFRDGGTIPLARGGAPASPPPVTLEDLTRPAPLPPAEREKAARAASHYFGAASNLPRPKYASGGIADALPPARATIAEGGIVDRATAPRPEVRNARPLRPTIRDHLADILDTSKRNLGREIIIDWTLNQAGMPGYKADEFAKGLPEIFRR